MEGHQLTIAQISDLHCGHFLFDEQLMEHVLKEINDLSPRVVVVVGDLTSEGYVPEFLMAKRYLEQLSHLKMLVVPGNHDLQNVGFLHFRDSFGRSERLMRIPFHSPDGGEPGMWATIVAINSAKPDLDEGEVGHTKYDWIREAYKWSDDYRIFVLHHHLVPVPGTGRERNIVWDAGDVLALLSELEVDLVLCGHKHVPNVWQLGRMLVVNSGTATSHRLRGYTRPSYNVIEISQGRVRIVHRYPGLGEIVAASYERDEGRLSINPQLAGIFNRGAWNL